MNEKLSKAIMRRSRLRKVHSKLKTKDSWEAFRKQRHRCLSIKRKNIRSHFTNLARDARADK